jgi:hypothetical protein
MFGTNHTMFGTEIPFREDIELQLRDIEALNLSTTDLDEIYAGKRRLFWEYRLYRDCNNFGSVAIRLDAPRPGSDPWQHGGWCIFSSILFSAQV